MPIQASRTISAANQWTTPISIVGWFNVGISRSDSAVGTLGGSVVTVQRSWDGVTFYDVDRWTKTSQDVGFDPDFVWYTIGVKPGEFSGANLHVAIAVLGSMRS